MRLAPLSILCATVALGACSGAKDPVFPAVVDPLAYADPRMGSGGFAFAAGSAYPGAAAPNGMIKVGPDTSGPVWGTVGFLHFSGYWDGDDTVQGFSHLHLSGTGASDYGVLSVMPLVAFRPDRRTVQANEAHFDKATETASPGYYAVTLDGGVRAEFTATSHVAHHRYTFPAGSAGHVVLFDLAKHLNGGEIAEAEVRLFPEQRRLHGRLHSNGGMSGGFGGYDVYFEVTTRQAWKDEKVWKDGVLPVKAQTVVGHGVGFELELDGDGPVELQVATSFLSNAGAAGDIVDEEPQPDFEKTRAGTEAAWRARLGTVRAFGGTEVQRRMLYSSLHHLFVMPSIVCDTDGGFLYAGQKEVATGWRFVSELSLWDTYRTLNPIYALVAPDRALDVVKSLDAMGRLGGAYPLWPIAVGDSGVMLGAGAEVVIADAYLKGVRGFDARATYGRLRAAALAPTAPAGGRGGRGPGFDRYASLGYVPLEDADRSVSQTLEYAQDDFALGLFAGALGLADDAAALGERSHGYRKLWDPATGFLRARSADGKLRDGAFDPLVWDDHAEANAWQSVWGAPHDVAGTAALFGGHAPMVDKLSRFFELAKEDEGARRAYAEAHPEDLLTPNRERPYYWAGNEPDIHAAFLFAELGRPDLTQRWVAWVRDTFFRPTPDGLPGNDDGGTLSAWWVWSALGFYPVVGSDLYVVGAPLFPRLELQVNGGTFAIEAPAVSETNIYVQSVTLNGTPLEKPMLRHADLKAGGTLRFELGPGPSTWGR